MLTAEQIAALRDISGQLMDPVVEFLIRDIARRVSEAGQLTSTAAYQTWRLQKLGVPQKQLKKELQEQLKASQVQVEQLFTQAAETGYDFDISRFPTLEAIPFEENTGLQQIVNASVKLAQDDLTNITQTIGFVTPTGKAVCLTEAYKQTCDFAFMKVTSGAQDYISAVREATKALAEKGIQVIDYESGVHTSLEAAVRRNIMGGLGLMQEQISQQNHDDLGCDGWEISAHAGSAPDHEPIQGKQYPDKAFHRLNNSLHRRIGTLSCGHEKMPIILGVNSPQYTDEELEEFRKQNEEGITVDGKHYTLYEATQRQGSLERSIRKRKAHILVDEELGDTEKLQQDQIRLQILKQRYHEFSKAAGLPEQYERLEKAGFTWKHGRAAEKASKRKGNEVMGSKSVPLEKSAPTKSTSISNQSTIAIAPANNQPALITNTPQKPQTLIKGCTDVTQEWLNNATPNSHEIMNVAAFMQDGIMYQVDGVNVIFAPDKHEKEIAELLKSKLGGDIRLMPKVSGKYKGVQTPDFIFRGQRYDLKTMDSSTSKRAVYNALKSKQEQADNFILDITKNPLGRREITRQIEEDLFCTVSTRGTKVIVLVEDGDIVNIFRRK